MRLTKKQHVNLKNHQMDIAFQLQTIGAEMDAIANEMSELGNDGYLRCNLMLRYRDLQSTVKDINDGILMIADMKTRLENAQDPDGKG